MVEDCRLQTRADVGGAVILVEKTGGPAEARAFALLRDYVARHATVE